MLYYSSVKSFQPGPHVPSGQLVPRRRELLPELVLVIGEHLHDVAVLLVLLQCDVGGQHSNRLPGASASTGGGRIAMAPMYVRFPLPLICRTCTYIGIGKIQFNERNVLLYLYAFSTHS